MACWFALDAMATANYSTTLEILKFAQDVEGLDLSKKKRIPIKNGIASPLLINVEEKSNM